MRSAPLRSGITVGFFFLFLHLFQLFVPFCSLLRWYGLAIQDTISKQGCRIPHDQIRGLRPQSIAWRRKAPAWCPAADLGNHVDTA